LPARLPSCLMESARIRPRRVSFGLKFSHPASSAFAAGHVKRQIKPEGAVVHLDLAICAPLRHCLHDDCAEPTPFGLRYWWSFALGPNHGQGLTVAPPADIDTSRVR